MKNFVYFIGWLLKRMFGGVIRKYYEYDKFVVNEPGIAIMPTFLMSIVASFVTMFSISHTYNLSFILYSMLFASIVPFVNYFRILLREQYRKYMREQEKFLNTLRG
jgi:ABC-type multidrug transport system fused ATPase/permease subunit